MAKKVIAIVKLQCPAGQANPSPPVGPALGQHGVNIMEFCKTFNTRTLDKAGLIIPAVVTIYAERSFTFEKPTDYVIECPSTPEDVFIKLAVPGDAPAP